MGLYREKVSTAASCPCAFKAQYQTIGRSQRADFLFTISLYLAPAPITWTIRFLAARSQYGTDAFAVVNQVFGREAPSYIIPWFSMLATALAIESMIHT